MSSESGPTDDADDDLFGQDEQDLLVVLQLSNRQMGTNQERADLEAFAEELAQAVEQAGVGEYDGDELGGGECVLFFCGPDVDQIVAVLRPLLQHAPLARGARFERMVEDADGECRRERFSV